MDGWIIYHTCLPTGRRGNKGTVDTEEKKLKANIIALHIITVSSFYGYYSIEINTEIFGGSLERYLGIDYCSNGRIFDYCFAIIAFKVRKAR